MKEQRDIAVEVVSKRPEEAVAKMHELEKMVDNAHAALSVIIESGEITDQDLMDAAYRGLNNQPQEPQS